MSSRLGLGIDRLARGTICTLLIFAPLALGGRAWWAFALVELLASVALLLWALHMARHSAFEWRRTPIDLPLALMVALVLLQLAIGNTAVATWALSRTSMAPTSLPTPFLTIGTIAPGATRTALSVLLTYAAVYFMIVNLFRRRRHLETLVRVLLLMGVVAAAAGLLDRFAGDVVFGRWRDGQGRVASVFTNADHFGAWLNLIIFLGIGCLIARASTRPPASTPRVRLSETVEHFARRYALVVTVVLMALALVFTMSRGAILSFIAGLVVIMLLAAATGLMRRTFVTIGVLLAAILAYAVWLGLGPLLARVRYADLTIRWAALTSSLPLWKDFPILGSGFGTYQEISSLHQKPPLNPDVIFLNAAHNDWLQILLETGGVGFGLLVLVVGRVTRDLVSAHLLGRGRCPVGGGEGEWARRHDPFSVGVSIGALGGLAALAVHSLVDFPARLASIGTLAAASLGIATVALHTRFGSEEGYLASRLEWTPARARTVRVATGAVCLAIALGAVATLRPAVVEALLGMAGSSPSDGLVNAALAVDSGSPRALIARADLRLETARAIAQEPAAASVQTERRRDAIALVNDAIRDLRQAIAKTPSAAMTHEKLGWAYRTLAAFDIAGAPKHAADGVSHLQRAIALSPENPLFYRSLAELTVAAYPDVPVDIGIVAARNAVGRRPGLLPDLVYQFLLMPMTDAQWLALVPDTMADRLALGDLLERRNRGREALVMYRKAVDIAEPADQSLARWLLARALMRQHDHPAALRELGAAMKTHPENPELYFAAAEALAATNDPAALDMYRAAVMKGEEYAARGGGSEARVFPGYKGRLQELLLGHLPNDAITPLVRYRRALARYLAHRELWRQAMQESEAVLKDSPRDPVAHFVQGMALEGLGQLADAVEAYRAAVALDNANLGYRMRLAKILWETKQPFQAINEWSAIVAQDEGNLDAALALARAYLDTGAKADALQAYQRVLRIAPDNTEARRALNRLGWIPQ